MRQGKIQIDQKLVISRSAFKATLEIDNESDDPLEEILVEIDIRNETGEQSNDLLASIRPNSADDRCRWYRGIAAGQRRADWLLCRPMMPRLRRIKLTMWAAG